MKNYTFFIFIISILPFLILQYINNFNYIDFTEDINNIKNNFNISFITYNLFMNNFKYFMNLKVVDRQSFNFFNHQYIKLKKLIDTLNLIDNNNQKCNNILQNFKINLKKYYIYKSKNYLYI